MNKKPEFIHIELPCGGIASVSPNASPELLEALDKMLCAAAAQGNTNTSTDNEEIVDVNRSSRDLQDRATDSTH